MPLPDLYPPARPKLDGVGQGIWSTIGEWKILLHTTETRGVPGYQNGALAPHVTYWPKFRTWTQHFKFSRPSEALVAFDNDMVIQVEMICYSAKNIADEVGGLWVGDLTNEQLEDVAAFCRWVMSHVPVKPYWPNKQAFSYSQANAAGFRMTAGQFYIFNGVMGHQHAPPGNVHWDPGAFPWAKFMPLLQPEDDMPLNQADLDAIKAIVGTEIDTRLQAITIPDEPTRKAFQSQVNSVWHAKVPVGGESKKMMDILRDVWAFAKTAAEKGVGDSDAIAKAVNDEQARRLQT